MKANELSCNDIMIGDWVLDGNVYAQVTSITCDGIIETTHNEHSNIELVEPIPLTQEILEKNGFKKCAGNEWSVFKYEDDDYTKKALYQVLWSATELYLEIASYTLRTGEFNRMGVEFVHELQHALRLCGIEKEIEL